MTTLHGLGEVDAQLLKMQRRYLQLQTILIVFVAIIMGAALVLILLQGQKLTSIAEANKANGKLLIECSTPPELRKPPVKVDPSQASGDCYLRSKAQTTQAVSSIRGISIAAAACGAAHPGNVAMTQACVSKTLSENSK